MPRRPPILIDRDTADCALALLIGLAVGLCVGLSL